jgi:hypothetical protein
MEESVPTMSPVVAFLVILAFTIIATIVAYYSWFDYEKIPPFLGRLFPRGPLNHQKIASSKTGRFFYKLFSLILFLFMMLILFAMIQGVLASFGSHK